MEYRSSKVKPTLSERHRSNDRKFGMEESRHLRALKKKQEQKNSREQSLAKFRGTSCITTTPLHKLKPKCAPSSSTKKYSKKELEELGKIRYRELLKWKEERKMALEKEKNNRKPTFKSGLYKPDQPKFLLGSTEKLDHLTPFKFSQTLRDSTKKATPSVPKASLGTTKKALIFHTGVTPQSIISSDIIVKPIRRRAQRAFRPPPELGVSPFPDTPSTRRPVLKRSNSFAPTNFSFKAPGGLQIYNLKQSSSVLKSLSNLSSRKDKALPRLGKRNTHKVIPEEDNKDEEDEVKENFPAAAELEEENKDSLEDDKMSQESHPLDAITITTDELKDSLKDDKSQESHPLDAITITTDELKDYTEEVNHKEQDMEKENLKEITMTPGKADIIEDKYDVIDQEELDSEKESDNEDIINGSIGAEPRDIAAGCDENVFMEDIAKQVGDINGDNLKFEEQNGRGYTEEPVDIKDKVDIDEETKILQEEVGSETLVDSDTVNEEVEDLPFCSLSDTKALGRTRGRKPSVKRVQSSICTPPLLRLRPRTPCSRSTRRSMLAHCNEEHDHQSAHKNAKTPKSVRSGRKSMAGRIKHMAENSTVREEAEKFTVHEERIAEQKNRNDDDDIKKLNWEDEKVGESPLQKTPLIDERRTSVSSEELSATRLRQLVVSPWITRSRGSSSSSRIKKRKSVFGSNSKEEGTVRFEDAVPPEDLGASPSLKENQSKILELLQHTERAPESPVSFIWGPDTPQESPDVSQELQLENVELEETKDAVQLQTSSLKGVKRKRASKSVSLLLPTDEDDQKSNIRYPVTPVRRSSVSQRVSLLPGLSTHRENTETAVSVGDENLLSWNSPTVESSENTTKSKRGRKSKKNSVSQRISLLPGLSHYPEEGALMTSHSVGENVDLISWDSPTLPQTPGVGKRKSRKSININTPSRRSTRLGHI